jgi:hypothetical protein
MGSGSQSIQGQDIIPLEVWQKFQDVFAKYLPGWQTSGAYNYATMASTPLGAVQLNTLLHSGQHRWINQALIHLLVASRRHGND